MKEWIKAHRDRTMPLEMIFKIVNAKLRGTLPVLWSNRQYKGREEFLSTDKMVIV